MGVTNQQYKSQTYFAFLAGDHCYQNFFTVLSRHYFYVLPAISTQNERTPIALEISALSHVGQVT